MRVMRVPFAFEITAVVLGFLPVLIIVAVFFPYLINIEISAKKPTKGGRAINRTRRSLQKALWELKKRSEIISNFMNVLCGVNPQCSK